MHPRRLLSVTNTAIVVSRPRLATADYIHSGAPVHSLPRSKQTYRLYSGPDDLVSPEEAFQGVQGALFQAGDGLWDG